MPNANEDKTKHNISVCDAVLLVGSELGCGISGWYDIGRPQTIQKH